MPGFFSRRRKSHPAPLENWAILPTIPDSSYNKSFVEQKIHPDLNSLAEELSSSQGHELLDTTADKRDPYVEEMGFKGLEPSTRRSRRKTEAHTRTQEPEPVTTESQQIGILLLGSVSDTNCAEIVLNAESHEDGIRLPGATSPPSGSPISITASSSKKRWSIFGRTHARVPHRNSDASNATSDFVSRSRSQSSSSQPRSHSTFQRIARAESSQPRTPKSQYSMYNSTHHTGSSPSPNIGRDGLLPSPHTFGIPTPPQEPIAKSADINPYFGFPPPLPPLNHPAFRQAFKGHVSSTGNPFPFQTIRDVQDKFPRYSHSLPSLAHSGSNNTQFDTKGAKTRHRRASSRSNRFRKEQVDKTNKRQHHKNDSVTSIGTRRSSAEYSSKKALSVGDDRRDECWEVQVSKEMVRLALGEGPQVYVTPSSFGKACGEHVGFSIFLSSFHLYCFFSFSSWRLGRYWGLVRHFFCKASFEFYPSN